jgi:alpha-L-fucosidase
MLAMPAVAEYRADWEDLARVNESPEWFKDAKFGIYFHWAPYSVPAYGNEHYPRTMYGHPSGKKPVESDQKRNYSLGVGFQTYREHEFHRRRFGEPKDFEYHDLFPLFTAEHCDAEEWAELFAKAGARFAGPVAMHHDGYALWDSKVTPWNAAQIGPKRDLLGELAAAIRKRDMKFVATFHHAKVGQAPADAPEKEQRRWHYYGRHKYLQREAPERVGSDTPELQKLYGTMGWDRFCDWWNKILEEVIDNYRPDMIWFDSWLDRLPRENRARFAAYYFNAAEEWGREVLVTYKQHDLPQNVGVVDFEKGRLDELTEFCWLTDDTISAGQWTKTGSWSYTEELDIKSAKTLLHMLIDIVSKNGCLLLNISPTADGIIDDAQRRSLLDMGDWLRANGEAVYGTRPFVTYGEGPKRIASSEHGGHFTQMSGDYNAENIRFTTRGNTIYAIQLGWAGSEAEVTVRSLAKSRLGQTAITGVSVVSSDEAHEWRVTDEGLVVKTPFRAPNKTAVVFRIETKDGWRSCTSDTPARKMESISIDG